jgi:mono/diheme cytochrome c family protein/glucose/arabinose dehydrogenase
MYPRQFLLLLCLTAAALLPQRAAAALELKKGDHIAITGSGLADRQQHHAWLETLIHQAHPDLDLTVRNLGFAADEVNRHPRSDEVPKTEYFLNMNQGDTVVKIKDTDVVYKAGTHFHATVILAYWGFNESFQGPAGLEDFRKHIDEYVKTTVTANYGSGAPRLVLFSPIAHEDLKNPNYADGSVNNQNLQLYSAIIGEVAAANKVQFVDLYHPSLDLFRKAAAPLTINGIHLSEAAEKIRAAVLEKNLQWHHRYRTVDQYNIYGQRSRIKYEGVDNATILGQEMAQRDVKTANRDRAVHAAAKGQAYTVKDDNLPPVDLTPPNLKQQVPYLDGEASLADLTAPEGCKVEFMASEKTFPELINPVQMNFDTKGRLWIAVWPSYPETSPTTTNFDKLIYFDLDPKTGRPIKCTTFLDGLNCPTGFQFYKDGVIVMQSPDLWFCRDTDGDGKADTKERILHGLDAADSHHETNSICYEPGGAIYLSDGVFHRTNVETASGPVRNVNGAIYRFEPGTGKFMRHAAYGFANPHGRVFDYWGNDLITDATGNNTYFGPGFSGHLDTGAHGKYDEFWPRPSRPCAGTTILTSRHFPDDWQHTFLNANVIGFQGIFRASVAEEGSGLKGTTIEPALVQADTAKNPNFRPSGVTVAPDGSLYFMDWSQMLIGHLQHHLRDPNRDHQHGRLYRITYPSRPLLEPKPIDGQPIAQLLDLLKEPENDVRLRAKIELSKHATTEVIPALQAWAKQFSPDNLADAHHLLEALWVHQWNNVVNLDLITGLLKSPDPRARAQALRVVCYQRDRIPAAFDMAKTAIADPAPRVRLEAVRMLSFLRGPDTVRAIEAANLVRDEKDYYINYCYKETMKQLGSLPEGKDLVGNDDALQAALKPKAEITYGPTNRELSAEDRKVYNLGRKVFSREAHCITCHQPDGKGLANIYPPLEKSEWIEGDPTRLIKIVLKGLYGPMTLHGKDYGPEKGTPPMTAFSGLLKDDELAAVVSYVRQSYGNNASIVTPAQVKAVRDATSERQQFYTVEEILKEHPLETK